jgi:SAM-dependent methyltransferase
LRTGKDAIKPWFEDDSFWQTFAPVLFDESRWKKAPEEVAAVMSLLGLEPGADILDLCCGVGRHAIEFARKGCRVTGVDLTEGYLRRARERAGVEGVEVEFARADMREFMRPGAFDAVVNMFTSFGYFEDRRDDQRVMERVYRSLRPGGAFLVDVVGKEILARRFLERQWDRLDEEGTLMLEERKVSQDWGWIENRWILFKGKERKEYRFDHRIYSAVELGDLFRETGFKDVVACGDLSGAPYDQDAKRLIVIGRKS